MRHSLHAHVMYLENTIRSIRERLVKRALAVDEIEDLELQLTLAESALEHYRQAYALEISVSSPEPHPPSGPDSEMDANFKEKRKSEGKKGGPTQRGHRSRNKAAGGWAFRVAAAQRP